MGKAFAWAIGILAVGAEASNSVSMEVSSGGVSLGSYQGGYLYARTLALRDDSEYRILTGASAGAINMLGGLYYCYHAPRPGWSPYLAWLNIGWSSLKPGKSRGGHIFEVDAISRELDPIVQGILAKPDPGLAAPKAVWLGFATTRFLPRLLSVPGGLSSPKMDEKILIGMQWLPAGHEACLERALPEGCWRAWTEVDTLRARRAPQLVVDFGRNGTDTALIARNLKDLALASSAFPVAFPRHPVRLYLLEEGPAAVRHAAVAEYWGPGESHPYRYGLDSPGADDSVFKVRLTGDPAYGRWRGARFPTFSDGGIFENEPLQLAQKARDLIRSKRRFSGMDSLSEVRFVSPMHYDPLFLDTTIAQIHRSDVPEWILFYGTRHGQAAERMEVTRFLEQRDFDDGKIRLSTTSLPLAGEHFAHFSAFMRKEFREFDFTVGMHDAFSEYLEADTVTARMRAIRLLQPLDTNLAGQLGFLWKKIDSVYGAARGCPTGDRGTAQHILSMEQAAVRLEEIADKVSVLPSREFEARRRLSAVLSGSLERMRLSMRAIAEGGEESDRDRFDHFASGYSRWGVDDSYFLGRDIADSFYKALGDIVDADGLGTGNSFLYPLAVYHARAGMAAATGSTPSFHMPYARIDGSKTGFRLAQGMPLFQRRFALEVGEHFLEGRLASRHFLHGYVESSLGPWWLHWDLGFALETPVDFKHAWFWPRADFVVADVLVIGLDWENRADLDEYASDWRWGPVVSIGSRIGFDFWAVAKGSLRGTNAERRIK